MFNCMVLLIQMDLRAVYHAHLSWHISNPPEALYCPQNEVLCPCSHTELLVVVPLDVSRPSSWNSLPLLPLRSNSSS